MNGVMWPMNTLSKAKRLVWGPEQNQASWAYMKMLRESNKNMRVYNICPYIEVYPFGDGLYGLFNQNCDGMGDVWEYLIVGSEKAMLIDTAFGIGDIKGLCDLISGGKELIVANTHIGPDHALGDVRFDPVYCHELEYANIKRRVQPHAWDYMFDEHGNNRWLQFDKKDLPEYKEFELIPVKNHHIWNLGGDHNIELIYTGAHATGHSMFLDRKYRRIFAGDVVCSDVINVGSGNDRYCTVETYHKALTELVERLDEFDYIFPGHFMVYLENNLFLDIKEALEKIMKDPLKCTYTTHGQDRQGNPKTTCYMQVRGFSVIQYDPYKGVFQSQHAD
ncbi:MAG: hypothetical protein II888_04445 [Clostridia bacterium]|nr:hypothetical protein [Clostridia bacterium]